MEYFWNNPVIQEHLMSNPTQQEIYRQHIGITQENSSESQGKRQIWSNPYVQGERNQQHISTSLEHTRLVSHPHLQHQEIDRQQVATTLDESSQEKREYLLPSQHLQHEMHREHTETSVDKGSQEYNDNILSHAVTIAFPRFVSIAFVFIFATAADLFIIINALIKFL